MSNNQNSGPLVLSYNICFQAMTNNASGSAYELGKNCTYLPNSKLTICANNMAQMIDAIPASMGVSSFDLVGFQEASRWHDLQKDAPNTSAQMSAIGVKDGRSEMVSFYNNNKYKLIKALTGHFSQERPFQILILKNLFDDSGTIFINAHNPHSYPFEAMQSVLGKAVGHNLSTEEKKYRIIAVGDFNETGWDWIENKMKQSSWTPFIDSEVETSIKVGQPVFSCCQGDGKWSDASGELKKGSRGGDYVFDSKAPADIQVPPKYDPSKLKSDHLPVMALLS